MARDTKTARTKKKERKNIAAGVAHAYHVQRILQEQFFHDVCLSGLVWIQFGLVLPWRRWL